jgi:hypothetical protein
MKIFAYFTHLNRYKPRMIHAWPLWNARLEAGRRALASAGAFISAAFSAA